MSATAYIANSLIALTGGGIFAAVATLCRNDQPDEPTPHEGWEDGHETELRALLDDDGALEDADVDPPVARPYVDQHVVAHTATPLPIWDGPVRELPVIAAYVPQHDVDTIRIVRQVTVPLRPVPRGRARVLQEATR